MIVVDASVFNKLFLNEPDRPKAQNLFRYSIQQNVQLVAPHLLLYEALSAALHYQVPFDEVQILLDSQRAAGLRLVEPTPGVLSIAHEIARYGNPKSGYPSLPDCIYHALAIEHDGMFVTADKKHVSKAKKFGAIVLLDEWTSDSTANS